MGNPNQTLLNIAVTRLRKQGKQSMAENGSGCLYRDKGGNKCLSGQIIDDEHYTPSLEGMDATDGPVMRAILASNKSIGITAANYDQRAWDRFQAAHDFGGENLERFESKLAAACEAHGYTVPPITEGDA